MFFPGVFQLLVVTANHYYQQYLDKPEDEPLPLPDVTEMEMFLLLALILQMGHDLTDGVTRLLVKDGTILHSIL
jgi:hypothetical protein